MVDPFGRAENAEPDEENGIQYPDSFCRRFVHGGVFGILGQLLNHILHPHFGLHRHIHLCAWPAAREGGG